MRMGRTEQTAVKSHCHQSQLAIAIIHTRTRTHARTHTHRYSHCLPLVLLALAHLLVLLDPLKQKWRINTYQQTHTDNTRERVKSVNQQAVWWPQSRMTGCSDQFSEVWRGRVVSSFFWPCHMKHWETKLVELLLKLLKKEENEWNHQHLHFRQDRRRRPCISGISSTLSVVCYTAV